MKRINRFHRKTQEKENKMRRFQEETRLKKFSRFPMKNENRFYLIIVLTILIMRLSKLIFLQNIHFSINGIIIHHFWFGLVLLLIGFFIPKKKKIAKILLSGIGLGLVIDESIFMILGGGLDREYWKLPSVIGAVLVAIIVYPFRKRIEEFLLKINFYK